MCIAVGSTYSNFTQDENSRMFLVAVRFRTIPKSPHHLFFKQDKQNKEKAVIAQMVEQR